MTSGSIDFANSHITRQDKPHSRTMDLPFLGVSRRIARYAAVLGLLFGLIGSTATRADSGAERVDWTPGSSWMKKIDAMPKQAEPRRYAPPAFGRDTMKPPRANRHAGNSHGSNTSTALHPMVVLSPQVSTITLGLGEQDTPLIEQIADGLNDDPLAIYNWVLTKVEYVPYYGLVQGAQVTALEQRGNDYDQCVLLVSLLKQAEAAGTVAKISNINYVHADVTYSAADIASWVHWDPSFAASCFDEFGILASGTGTITVPRVYVTATIGGVSYTLDPAFKSSAANTASSLSQVASSYSATTLTSNAGGNTPSDDEVSGVNVDAFQNGLSSVETQYVRQATQQFRSEDARGLLGIPVLNQSPVATLPQALAQSAPTVLDTWTAIPSDKSLDLQITFGTQTITYHWCDLADDVFNISFDSSGRASLYRESQLELTEDGTPSGDFTVTGERIYPQNRATPITFASTPMSRSGRSVILPTFAYSDGRMKEIAMEQAELAKADPNSDATLIRTLAMLGLQREVHLENHAAIVGALTNHYIRNDGAVWFYHSRGSNWWVDGPEVVEAEAKYGSTNYQEGGIWESIWPFGSATESLGLEEMTSYSAASTVTVFESALRDGYSIFRLTPVNWNAMSPRVSGQLLSVVPTAVGANDEAFVTSTTPVAIVGSNGMDVQGAYCPHRPSTQDTTQVDSWWHSGPWYIDSGYHGSETNSAQNAPVAASTNTNSSKNNQTADSQNITPGGDPVDLNTGAFMYDHASLKIGNGAAPTSMDFHEYYSSAGYLQDSAKLGAGWTHSYDLFVALHHATDIDLRKATAAEIAPMVVASQYLLDTVTANPTAKEIALRALTAAWEARQFLNAKATVALGGRQIEFDKLSDGSFIQSSSLASTLTEESDGSFLFKFRHGNQIVFRSGDGRATSITDPYNNVLTLTYNGSELSTVTDAYQRMLSFHYDGSSRLSTVTDSSASPARTVTYGYNTNSFTITDPDNGVTTFASDNSGIITSVTDERNRKIIENDIDPFHRVSVQRPLGDSTKTIQFGYAPGQAFEKDGVGNFAWTTLDSRGRLVAYRDAIGNTTTWTYDGADRLIKEVKPSIMVTSNPISPTTTYTYDADDNLRTVTDPAGDTEKFDTPDAFGRLTTTTDFNGKSTTYVYSNAIDNIDPLSITAPGGLVTSYTYDTAGRVQTVAPQSYASGKVDTYGYDVYGNLQTISHPGTVNNVDNYTFDAIGDLKEFDDRNGAKTTYTYNSRRLRTSVTQWDGATQYTTTIDYDASGDVLDTIDASGHRTDYDHDALGHLLTVNKGQVGSQVPVLTNHYDDNRVLLSSSVDALGDTTRFVYDADQRLSDRYDPLNHDVNQQYDADSNPTILTTALGYHTMTAYTANGLKDSVQDGNGKPSDYQYDANGRMLTLANRLNNTYTWAYDDVNRTVTSKTPLLNRTLETLNTRGLLASIAKPSDSDSSPSITFDIYDDQGRLTQKTDGVAVTTYTYKPNGLPENVSESGMTTVRGYDALNRLNSYQDGQGNTITYEYTASGDLYKLHYPGGNVVTYGYDDLDRLHTVTDWASRTTTYSYDDAGHVTRIDRSNGTYRLLTYDAAGELITTKDCTSSGTVFGYEELHYDGDGRIIYQFLYPKPATIATPADNLLYDADNRLSTWNSQSVTFDVNGNMTNGPLPSGTFGAYTFDARNRLTAVGGSGYSYNPDGLRTAITGTGAATFVVDPGTGLSRTLSRTKNGTTTYYVYGLGLLYEVTGSAAKQYVYDHVGNTVAMTDDTQAVTDRWTYGSSGTVVSRSGSTDTPFQFNGKWGVQTDPNGLCYMRCRYYNPRLMRFINADPAGFGGGMNWYAFVGNNPISFIDPFGLERQMMAPVRVNAKPWTALDEASYQNWLHGTNSSGSDPSIARQAWDAAVDSGGRYAGGVNRAFEFWKWPQRTYTFVQNQIDTAVHHPNEYFNPLSTTNVDFMKQQFGTAAGWGNTLGSLLCGTAIPNLPEVELPKVTAPSSQTQFLLILTAQIILDWKPAITDHFMLPEYSSMEAPAEDIPFSEPIDFKPPAAGGSDAGSKD